MIHCLDVLERKDIKGNVLSDLEKLSDIPGNPEGHMHV